MSPVSPADSEDRPTVCLGGEEAGLPLGRSEVIPPAMLAWDRYEVLGFLGQGGMARVYRARDRKLNRMVALKFIREENQPMARLLTLEAQLQASLDHENIVKVYETGVFEGLPFIAMQLIQGETLDKVGRDDLRTRVGLLAQVARALDSAHRQGMVHRDLKPSNVMVESSGGRLKPFLMDFGLARLTNIAGESKATSIVGTLAYMSPEQAEGNCPLDIRTDVHGLGAILYEFLCGHPPFAPTVPGSQVEILRRLLDEDAAPLSRTHPEVPRDLETIALKCLEKQPERRYPTALAMAEDLERWLEARPIEARPLGLLERGLKAAARLHKNQQAWRTTQAAGLLLVALLGLGTWALWRARLRAEFVAHTGMALIRLEEIVQTSEMGPLHDTRPDRRRVSELLNQIRQEAAHYGALTKGPLAYAQGRCHLALHDYEAALDDLQASWELGFRTPDAAEGLGIALGEVYQIRRRNLEQEKDPERRKKLRAELQKSLQEPALHYLAQARGGALEEREYRAALADAIAERHGAVLARTELLLQNAPLGFRYFKLRAAAEMGLAQQAIETGDNPKAQLRIGSACQALRQVVEIARSDKESWLNLAKAADRLIYLSRFLKGDPQESFAFGMEACAKARTLDPDDPVPLIQEAELIRSLARAQESKGEDPTQPFEEAIARLDQALRLAPDNLEIRQKLGLLYWSLANISVSRQKPCQELLRQAEDQLRLVLARRPGDVMTIAILLDVIFDQCQDRERRGEEVLPTLDEAIALFERSRELDPSIGRIQNVGVILFIDRGFLRAARGLDPLPDWTRGLALVEEVLARNPAQVPVLANRSLLLRVRAEHKWRIGVPYEADLQEAIETCVRGRKLRDSNDILINQAQAVILKGELRARAGGDPRRDLGEALLLLTQAETQDPKNPNILYSRMDALLSEAAWLQKSHQRATAPLRACRQVLERSRGMAPLAPDMILDQARLLELESEEATQAGGAPAPILKKALASLDLLDQAPSVPAERKALRARILRRLADCGRGPEAERVREEARVLLIRALAENPFLTGEYGTGPGSAPPPR